jgi:serine protease Do
MPRPVTIERRQLLRLVGAGGFVIVLMAGSAFVGATFLRGDSKPAQQVAAPAASPPAPVAADAMADLIEAACPAIVSIEPPGGDATAAGAGGPLPRDDRSAPPPAGFLISADGYLVTSLTGLAGQARAHVLLNDGRAFDATLSGQDPLSNLALLKIDASGLPFLAFADAHFPRTGAQGVVLASPNGSGCLAQAGRISADFLAERAGLWSYVELRPALDPDFAGAPFLDRDRHVAGIAGLRPGAGAGPGSALLPAGTAASIVSELLRNDHASVNRFGIVVDDLLPELAARAGVDRQRGAVIALIREGSPAALAGQKAGHVVLSASGAPLSGASELLRALDTDDRHISLEISRRSRRIIFNLTDSARSPS